MAQQALQGQQDFLDQLRDLLGNVNQNATAPTVTFASTPGQLKADQVIDYSTKRGLSLYEAATAALEIKFDLQSGNSVVFVRQLQARA